MKAGFKIVCEIRSDIVEEVKASIQITKFQQASSSHFSDAYGSSRS
jgi:hypothetical protein